MKSDMVRLIEPLIPALRRYARVLLKDRAAADDLVQDCLERVISHWHQRRADGDTRSWMFAILHNLAMTRLKRRTNSPLHIAIEDAQESLLSVPPSQEDRLRYRELLAALSQMPEDQRAVLLLVGVEDLSYAETANVLGVPVGTIMSRLSRARERLLKATSGEVQTSSTASPNLRRVK
jgi:RNA polymerase sigma factor (sigma-70 family)